MLQNYDQKVFGWYADFDGCGYYRIIKPLEELAQPSFRRDEIWRTSWDRKLPADWRDYDAIIGQRVINSDGNGNGPADKWVGEITRERHLLAVYELDDDLFNVDPSNPASEFFNNPGTQGNLKVCITRSDLVTVSTEPLRQQILKWNPNVKVVPNFIDEDVLEAPRIPQEDKVVIGWFGSPTHAMDFAPMAEELGVLMATMQETRFMTIGGNFTHGLPMDRVRAMGWIGTPRKLYKHVAKFDIGIAPLLPHPFNEAKSYIKALEYAALGIPCVASNFGPYRDFIEHGVTGFLVDKPGQWREYIGLLVKDADLRHRMGNAARDQAEDYTIQKNVGLWAEALRA